MLLSSVRHAHWGPEGPVGGWLLLVPYLFMAAAVTAALIAWETFSWVPGGRLTCFSIWVGLLVAFAVSGYYSMSEFESKYEQIRGVIRLAAARRLFHRCERRPIDCRQDGDRRNSWSRRRGGMGPGGRLAE